MSLFSSRTLAQSYRESPHELYFSRIISEACLHFLFEAGPFQGYYAGGAEFELLAAGGFYVAA